MMDPMVLAQPQSAAIVLGGTLAATVLRCGWSDARAAGAALIRLHRPGFDKARMRADLARQVEAIRRDGVLRAPDCSAADGDTARAANRLLDTRSIAHSLAEHRRSRRDRRQALGRARRTLEAAGDLAPIAGLAGTLLALAQLSRGLGPIGPAPEIIGAAVVTTFYGLVAAHLLFHPLARLLERRGEAEEAARAELIDWLAEQAAPSLEPVAIHQRRAA